MKTSVYDFTKRVRYRDFVRAAETTVIALIKAHKTSRPELKITAQGGPTAQVSERNGRIHLDLPTMDADTHISGPAARRLLAFVTHEVLHLLFTKLHDIGGVRERTARSYNVDVVQLARLSNVLEDHHIERLGTLPGSPVCGAAAELLGGLNDEVMITEPIQSTDPVEHAILWASVNVNRHGQQPTPKLDATIAAHRANTPAHVRALVDAYLDLAESQNPKAGQSIDDTVARVAGAADILRDLSRADAQQPTPPDPDKDGAGKDGADKDGAGAGKDGAGAGKDGAGKDGAGKDGAGKDGAADGAGKDGAGKDGAADGADKDGAASGVKGGAAGDVGDRRAQVVVDSLPHRTDRELASAKYAPMSAATSREFKFDPDTDVPTHANIQRRVNALAAMDARRMSDAFRRGLRSVEKQQTSRRELAGRIDPRALPRGMAGCRDIYTSQTLTPGISTAVQVMLDGSSSMGYAFGIGTGETTRWQASCALLTVLLPALKRAGALSAAAVFSTYGSGSAEHTTDLSGTCEILKPFRSDRNWREAVEARANRGARGGTPMAREAVWAGQQVLAQQATRRIVLWLCDGEASDGRGLEHVVNTHRARGIEHVAIGLQHPDIGERFGKDFAVNSQTMADLPDLIEKVLRMSGGKSGW